MTNAWNHIAFGIKYIGIGLALLWGSIWNHGPILGTATVTTGNNYPTSSYSFSDNDIINAGDLNNFSSYMGIRSATDTVTLQGQIYNVSTTRVTGTGQGGIATSTTPGNSQVPIGNTNGTYSLVSIPDCNNASSSKLIYSSTTLSFTCTTDQGASTFYGPGTDGIVTQTASTTLTSDKFYDTFTIATSVVVNTGGFRIYVKNTLTVNGTLQNNGSDGPASSTSQNGNSGGVGGAAGSLTGGKTGGRGGNGGGTNQNGQNASSGPSTSFNLGVSGVAGGDGGTGNGTPSSPGTGGGAGGVGSISGDNLFVLIRYPSSTVASTTTNAPIVYSFTGSTTSSSISLDSSAGSGGGGGGGGSSGVPTGAGGGGGGGSGGIVYVIANTITVGSSGIIQSNGGKGGPGNIGSSGGASGGGGGGGSGGVIVLGYATLTNNGTIQANGNTGGLSGGANPGNSGSNGNSGNIYKVVLQ